MRARLHIRLIGAFLVPALVVSGAAQGMLLMRCGEDVRMSCCCPAEQPAPDATVQADSARCCDTVAIPAAPSQAAHEVTAPTMQPQVVAVAAAAAWAGQVLVDRVREAPRLDPPPGLSPVLANCALLI